MEEHEVPITKWKKPVGKGYRLYDSNSRIFWKRYNYSKKMNGCQGLGGKREEEVEHRGFLRQ